MCVLTRLIKSLGILFGGENVPLGSCNYVYGLTILIIPGRCDYMYAHSISVIPGWRDMKFSVPYKYYSEVSIMVADDALPGLMKNAELILLTP
jgi:hypothetical protein